MRTTYAPGAMASARGGTRGGIAGEQYRPNNTPTAELLADLRFRADVARLHRLGARVLFEALREFGERRMVRFELEELVGRYASIDPLVLRATGADQWPPLPPPRLVREGAL